jgi:periplasmic divalent cation tolerance protein
MLGRFWRTGRAPHRSCSTLGGMDAYHVLATTDSRDEADRLGRLAVVGRLAACAQVAGPVTSTYRWQGAVETATEWHVWMKTTEARLESLIELIRSNHTYDVPEIIATPITAGNPAYLEWVAAETAPLSP